MDGYRSPNHPFRQRTQCQPTSCLPAFLRVLCVVVVGVHFVAASAMISCEFPRGAGTGSIFGLSINSSALYSGGIGGGSSFFALPENSSGNFAKKLCVGHEHASPKAQMVLPAILSATFFSTAGSFSVPPP